MNSEKFFKVTTLLLSVLLCGALGALYNKTQRYEEFHGQKVKVVDVMYTYEKDGKIVEGDYSFVSHKGYEYIPGEKYDLEYTEKDK